VFRQINVLHEVAAAISSGGAFHVAAWFTEDFRLHDPTAGDWPTGHIGASKLLEKFSTLTQPIKLEILDSIEEGNRVAVRWGLSGIYKGDPVQFAMMAIYRFQDGRIAEDWGIPIRGKWP
jgi:predicted SnoaL-like aldol condensation-catalyzing enzyme